MAMKKKGRKATEMPMSMAPGTPAGDRYLRDQAKERVRRGGTGFTRKGRGSDTPFTFGSKASQSGVAREGGTKKLPMRRRRGG